MKATSTGRLWFLRTLSVLLMLASVYIAWYTVSSGDRVISGKRN
jgi:hypothetical protein